MENVMMKCGHAANSTHNGKPSCVICFGLREGADQVDESPPDMSNRMAKCSDCKGTTESRPGKIAFFRHLPNEEFDTYYCGCRGWD